MRALKQLGANGKCKGSLYDHLDWIRDASYGHHNERSTQMTGQEKIPIFAETQTLFFLKVIDAQLEFKRDQSGKVTQVTSHQGGHDTVARKK